MKKLSVLLVAMAVAVSASAGINQKVARSIRNNKIVKTEKVMKADLRSQALKGTRIINEQPEGELKSYNRAGQGVYVSNGYVYCAQQDGSRMDIVWGEDGKVYLKDILFNFGAGTWVEGNIVDDTYIVVPLGQSMYWSDQYQADINLCWGHTYQTEDGKIGFERDMDKTEVTYLLDEAAGTITLMDSEGPEVLDSSDINSYLATGLTAYWTDDDSWYGNLEWNTVLTEREPVVTPTVITDQPEGELYTYVRAGNCIYSSIFGVGMTEQEGKMRVVFDGQGKAYIQNPMYWHDYNATGLYSMYSDDMTWAGALEYNTEGTQIIIQPAVPANAEALEWYDCGDESGFSYLHVALPTTDEDGNPIDQEYLSYSIFTDNDEIFVFDANTYYYDIATDMTEIPYEIWNNGYDLNGNYIYFYRTNEGQNGEEPFFKHKIGIRVYYTVDGVRNESPETNYIEVYPDTKVNELNADKTVASVRYFNVAGQEIAQPSGMTIQVTTYTDGTTSAAKVVK